MKVRHLWMTLTVLFLNLMVYRVDGSHFRGGLITWRPVNKNASATNVQVEFSFRFGWRRSYSSSTSCDKVDIQSRKLIGQSGSLVCFQGCSVTIGSTRVHCTDVSTTEDWSIGERSLVYSDFTSTGPFYIGYTGNAWISNLRKGSGYWRLQTLVNLTVRSDTGLMNSSPLSATAPIITLQKECNHTIRIPVTDEDGDNIRCRWAKNYEECGGICYGFVGAILDERECTVDYFSPGQIGWYAVAIVIEDFASRLSTQPLSSVPLQFLVSVYTAATTECASNPKFVGITRVDDSCVGVPPNSTFLEPIIAYSGGETFSITEIQTVSPQGFTKSNLAVWNAASKTWYVNVSYTPVKSTPGPEVFCYTAFSSTGSSSPQSCVTLLVGVAAPAIIEGGNYPVGSIMPNHAQWRISYDIEFVRPTRRSFIRFQNSKDVEVLKIDTSTSVDVSYPTVGNTLQFTTRYLFQEKETYSVLMDPGVVKGVEYCGAESEAVRDTLYWKIRIKDITPPKLIFVNAPIVTLEFANISWIFDEQVAIQTCTHQSPESTFTVQDCNNSWHSRKLEEGLHNLYVEATDLEGNISPSSRHSWTVDLTPPYVQIQSKPRPISNIQTFTFSFRCGEQCSFECAVTRQSVQPKTYYTCNSGTFKTDNLNDGETYTFYVLATDRVGNRALVKTYSWEIDITPPVIGQLSNQSVACGSNYDPSTTGYPTISDNRDSSPKLTYKDETSSSCSVKRRWILVDEAGNKAVKFQSITFTSKQPPKITFLVETVVPCGGTSEISGNSGIFRQTISVIHPCNRKVNVTYQDSDLVNRCGFTFWRTWTVLDDCGEKTTAKQEITILPLQLPESPQNNEFNVGLNKVLRWPQYPGAQSYQVYVWNYGQLKPKSPTATENYRRYIPYKPYQPGSRIFWQIQYVIGADQLMPSPVWGFQTKSFPDLAVINVVIPAYAFSGSIFDVSWRVENKGNISTGNNVWYDAVYISRFPNRGQASFATRKLQRNFLDPDDWYLSTTSIPLKESDLGNRYIFIETNIYRSVTEINHSNNIGTSAGAMYINLTPPPDLQVMEIVTPKSTFSGLSISIQWTVKNVGVGATRGNTWYDTAFWCTNTSTDDCGVRLVTVKRSDGLVPGAHYNVSSNIFVPNAIYGNYFILVQTDSKNSIYEHANEDNNVGVTKSSIHVTLTPPPDLIVVDLKLFEKLVYSTFEVIKLTYTVENKGSTAPLEPYWYDKVVIISAKTNKEVVISIFAVSIVLNPGHSYSRSATFAIPALFEHGTYTIAVRTDYRGNVFEFDAENNNARSTNVVILQQLPDLIVSNLTFLLHENSEELQIFVNWTVSNVGEANTLNFQWTDALYLQSVDGSFRFLLGERATRLSFKPGENYTASGIFSIPSHIFDKMDLILITNAIKQLDEKNNENNAFTLTIDIPMMVSDLMPTSLELFSSGQIFPNSLIKLQWTVKNIGKRKVTKKWEDSFYLFNSETYGPKQTWLGTVERRILLNPGGAYDVSAEVKIPENVYPGKHYIEVRVNNPETIYEAGQTSNNIAKINLVIQYPPAADLVITSVTYTSHYIKNVDRVLAVKWSGENIGNSMQSKKTWNDKVAIFAKNIDDGNFEKEYSLGTFPVTASLRTNQDYSMYKIIPIPQFVEGEIIVKITCDYDNTIREIGGESNNISPGKKKLNVGIPKRANLVYQFIKGFPKNATYSSSFNVVLKVRNVGEYLTPSSSWTDALFLYDHSSDTVDNIVARGIRLSTIHHNGELDVGGEYYINTSIRIPEISTRAYHVHVIVNLNDALRMKKTSSSNQSLIVNVGPLPDLTVRPIKSEDKAKRGGSLYKVRFNITNRGIIETNKAWFDAVYLSEDATLDPFDWRLGVAGRLLNLQPNETYTQTIDVFLPFDLPSREYYLIFNADSKDDVLETNNDNNQATQVINIQESPSTDLFVRHVEAPSVTTLNSETTLKWDLGNNGSLKVSGYRCDATYFSKDSKIDFDDYELGEPTCGTFEIYPSGNGKNNDITKTKNVRVPLVEQGTFKTIIRTRSNTRDINPKNNIGVSVNNTFINVTTLLVDGVVLPTRLKPLQEKVFRIPEVLSQQTLIVTLKSDTKTDVNNLYLREKKPPSSSEFDARSAGDLSANKLVTIPSTKALDYYLLVQNVGSLLQNHGSASNVQLFAKYAKFEVTSIFPTKAAPFGKTTVRIIGTLFPEYVEVSLSNKQNTSSILKPVKVYRFSSTEIYATFMFDGLELGTTFDLSLHDSYLESNKAIYSPSSGALQLFSGIPGQLSFNAKTSQALRPGESGFVNVHVYNKGDTDVLAKLMFLSIENVETRLNSGSVKSEYSSGIFFSPVSSKGPGGILPPKEYSDVLFEVKPDQNTREARIQIQTMGTSEDKEHIFIAEKELLKPFYYTDEQWEAVWKNFINLVGKTEKSLVNKLSDVSNYLSTIDRRIYDVNELIKFLIDVADGTFLAGSEPLIVDDVDSRESLDREYSLLLRRKYSFALGPRYSNGVLGRGWILPWWDTSVNVITPSDIFFEWERQQFIFEVIKPGVYYNAFLGELYVNQTSNSLTFVRSRTSFEYKYNTSSKLLTSIKRTTDNAVITISYNEVNNLPEKFTTSLGDSMTVTYDNTGKLKSTYTSSGGHITLSNYEYEEQSVLLKSVTVNGLKTVYQYDENGFLSEIHYPDNSTVVNRYGTNKLLEKSSLFASSGLWIETLVFKRNGNGQIEVTKQPLGLVTTYKYDDRNHLAFAGRNFETPFKMRDEGFSRYVFHGDEVISKTMWNADMRRLTQINAKGNPMEVLYDELGNVKEYDMGDGAWYRANFNSIGKLSELIYPDMSTQKYEYDEHSKISKITTRDGNIKKYYFESSGNLIQKAVDGSEKTFSYNQEGNMVSATNEVGTIFFDYASKGFPKYVRYPNNFTLRYTYDPKGRRSSFSYNDKNNISYLYEPDFGKLSKVVHNGNKLLMEIKYNRNGKVSRKTLGNGMYTVYEYDSTAINLLKLTNYYANATVTSHFAFSYDSRGRRILMNTTDGVWRYGYDSMSQLTFIKDPLGNVTRYTYDSRGNRLMEIKNNIRSYYTVNKLDQYVSHSKKSFSYDKNGNLVSINYPSKITQVFEFDADNNLVLAKQGQQRCRYVYDALGNLYEKRCKDGRRTSFIVDPFGVWGSEIVGKIVNGKEIIFAYGIEHGLIAQLQPQTKEVMYYQFDPQGSVVSLMGSFEELMNSYTYNTFGIVTRSTEKVENDFLFMGQWGVITSSELRNVCYMRARFYDAEEGRFMSIDPISFKGGSRNLYVYANSNPVSFVDPKGTIIPAMVIGGAANVLVYLGTQAFLGEEITGAGIAGSLVAGSLGGLGGLGISTIVRNYGLKGIGAGVFSLTQLAKTGALSSFAGKFVEQILRGKGLDGNELGLSTLNGLIPIPIPPFGKGRVGQFLSSVAGSAASSGIGISLQKKNEKALRRFNELKDKAKKYGKRILDNLIQWLRSFDPNDIIGPTGFGDSKFVRVNEKMLYKIRFENAENATAPAQRVLIKIKLDSDFDMRTFRLGSYGFGDYVADVEESKSFLQEKVRLIKPHNIYLRIQAGLDIVKGEASWTFQSIAPNTGFSPTDPRRGFLPPNNGTSGQGFVVFAINPKENLKTFTRIDAKAIIYFDKNEPIETPPIFNTIDAAYPVVTISLLNETSETGTPLFAFHKNDVGSGVRRVDLYVANASRSHEWAILMEDTTENIAFIPLTQGISNEVLVVGEDNVGNRDESGTNIQAIYIPEITNLCTSVNNCSGFGNCTGLNLCQCISGRYGGACNESTAPVEPPIIEFEPYYNISRSKAVPILVNSRLVQPLNGTSLTIIFSNILEGFTFNKGHVDDKRKAVFDIKDLANLTLIPPPGYSGYFNLTVTALAIRGMRSASRSGELFMYFQASESEPPTLKVKDICLNVTENEQKIPLINFVEVQTNSNEMLYLLHIMQLPSDFKIIPKPMAEKDPDLLKLKNNTIKIPTESLQFANVYIPRVYDNFKTVNVSVNLVIRSSQEVVVARAAFSIVLCFTDKQDPDGKKSTNYLIMAICIAAGLLFLVLLVVLICCVKKKCKGNSSKTSDTIISMELLSAN